MSNNSSCLRMKGAAHYASSWISTTASHSDGMQGSCQVLLYAHALVLLEATPHVQP